MSTSIDELRWIRESMERIEQLLEKICANTNPAPPVVFSNTMTVKGVPCECTGAAGTEIQCDLEKGENTLGYSGKYCKKGALRAATVLTATPARRYT